MSLLSRIARATALTVILLATPVLNLLFRPIILVASSLEVFRLKDSHRLDLLQQYRVEARLEREVEGPLDRKVLEFAIVLAPLGQPLVGQLLEVCTQRRAVPLESLKGAFARC